MIRLATEQLILRELSAEDFFAAHEILGDAEVMYAWEPCTSTLAYPFNILVKTFHYIVSLLQAKFRPVIVPCARVKINKKNASAYALKEFVKREIGAFIYFSIMIIFFFFAVFPPHLSFYIKTVQKFCSGFAC